MCGYDENAKMTQSVISIRIGLFCILGKHSLCCIDVETFFADRYVEYNTDIHLAPTILEMILLTLNEMTWK